MLEKIKENRKLFIIIGLILLIGVIALCIFLFTNKEMKNNSANNNEIVYNEPGKYDVVKEYDKVTIECDGVELSNIKTNELIVSEKVGSGTVKLDNVEVKNKLQILGGGPNSVYVNNSNIKDMSINYNKVRVVVDVKSTVEKIVSNDIDTLELSGKVKDIIINKKGKLQILENSKVENLEINDNINLNLKSSVDNIKINNEVKEVVIETSENVVINKITTNSKTVINGSGKLLNFETNNKNNLSGEIDKKDINYGNLVSYTITFDSNGGSNIESKILYKNDKLNKPTNPTRDGYTFIGWQYNNKDYDFNSGVEKDITLKAIWEKKPEKLTTTKKDEVSYTDYKTTYVNDKNMLKNTKKTVTNGIKGTKTTTYEIVTNESGKVISKKAINETVVNAIDEVIYVGVSDYNLNKDYISSISYGIVCTEDKLIPNGDDKDCDESNGSILGSFFSIRLKGKDYVTCLNATSNSCFNNFNTFNVGSLIELRILNGSTSLNTVNYQGVKYILRGTIGDSEQINLTDVLCSKYNLSCGRW